MINSRGDELTLPKWCNIHTCKCMATMLILFFHVFHMIWFPLFPVPRGVYPHVSWLIVVPSLCVEFLWLSQEEDNAVIVDAGSFQISYGVSGDDAPKDSFTSAVCGNDESAVDDGAARGPGSYVIDASVFSSTSSVARSPVFPLNRGIVSDWAAMETLLRHAVTQCRTYADVSQTHVFFTGSLVESKENRAKCVELAFESMGVESFAWSYPTLMAMYCSGRTTGLVVEVGHSRTQLLACVEGYQIPQLSRGDGCGGVDVSEALVSFLGKTNPEVPLTDGRCALHVHELKCAHGRVAESYTDELLSRAREPVDYPLPDGRLLKVGAEPVMAGQVLLDPSIAGVKDRAGLADMITSTLAAADMDLRADLYKNIIFSGGASFLQGLIPKLRTQLAATTPHAPFKLLQFPECMIAPFIGSSILTSLGSFKYRWIQRAEYEEAGVSILDRKPM